MSFESHTVETAERLHTGKGISGADRFTARLLARPPLAIRAGEAAVSRQRIEADYRLGAEFKDETTPASPFLGMAVCVLRTALRVLGLYRRGVQNAQAYRLVRDTLVIPDLPADLDGFRILHISDFHLSSRFPELASAMGRVLDGVEVELAVLTGDYRFGYFGPTDYLPTQLRTILSGIHAPHGIVSVLGNHDTFAMGQLLEASGFPVLYNEGITLQAGRTTIWLCGIDEPHNFECDRVDAAVAGAPAGAYTILLAHTPERIREAEAQGVDLYLTGHTHGGQIRLPVLGALIKNANCDKDQVWGSWQYKRMTGYTTCGIGVTDVPVRFNCPPEAVLLTLRRPSARGCSRT